MPSISIETATGRRIVERDYVTAAQSAYVLMSEDERATFIEWVKSFQREKED